MNSAWITVLACIFLSACGNLTISTKSDSVVQGVEARFALKVSTAGQPVQSSSGRLTWERTGEHDRILISTPLGYGIAEVLISPMQSSLKTTGGKTRTSESADQLLLEATGFHLPVMQLPAWLTGQPAGNATIVSDSMGRPVSLTDERWAIEYIYDDDLFHDLPSRINLNNGSDIELRLRIEEWKTLP